MRHVGGFRRGDQDLAVWADADALRLDADRHLCQHLARIEIDHRDQIVVLIGDVDRVARGVDVELLRVRAGGKVANDLVGGDIEDLHRVVVARADEKRLAVLGQHDAARALADADRLLHLQRVAVDDGDRVALLIRDIDGVGESIAGDAAQAAHHGERHGDASRPGHVSLPWLASHRQALFEFALRLRRIDAERVDLCLLMQKAFLRRH